MIEAQENRRIGNNVEALCEIIEDILYITFKDEQGEPLLIFSQFEAAIMRFNKHSQDDKRQLLFRMNIKYYILTFSSCDKAKEFSKALLRNVTALYMRRVDPDVIDRFEKNQITIDSPQFFQFL